MAPTIPNIPPELVSQIIQQYCLPGTIATCLLVNREWHDFALPVLYKDLVLSGTYQMERFLAAHNDSLVRSSTRSLTLYLREYGEHDETMQARIDDTLSQLAKEAIPHMSSLVSFSLTADRRTFRMGILRTTISALLIALPRSCRNLELDTDGSDETSFWSTYQDRNRFRADSHVCAELGRMIHRFHNARINLKSVCEYMFGFQRPDDEYYSTDLPVIQNLLIETTGSTSRPPCTTRGRETSSWPQMIRTLQHVARNKGTAPGGKLSVLGEAVRGGRPEERFYQTLLRCEMRGGEEGTTTLAFPAERFDRASKRWGSLYARTDEGAVVMESVDSFYEVAGGRPWRTTASNARLPVSVFPDMTWASDKELGIFTEQEWRKKSPEGPQIIWNDEMRIGAQLMNVEERKNDIELRKVKEKLPDGFIRVRHAIRHTDPTLDDDDNDDQFL
ncbi:hypothetical protein CEP54_008098 [Fusarium duplospermum]|uniref:F-box domain-containing protein n=1 Tax=Fusarium duplospermum TaxID=1325734 RepID=A0A428PXJ4_9HYPO|nr:hypothetical protein CEP54_008098 [Fusarium duplospermum]